MGCFDFYLYLWYNKRVPDNSAFGSSKSEESPNTHICKNVAR